MRIKLSYHFANEPLFRQMPGGLGVWKGHRFLGNDPADRTCDMWVVLDDTLEEEEVAFVQSGRAVLITLEPPMTREYQPDFLAQFDLVVSCHRNLRHPNVRNEYQGQPWHIGMDKGPEATDRTTIGSDLTYDDFVAMQMPPKRAALSVVCSASSRLSGHRARREFVDRLQTRLGERVDAFGRGVRPIADKAEAILPYRYHIALENSRLPDYWTEKLADAYLGWSFPIYWGCPNIGDYFPEGSLVAIDISRPTEAIDIVEMTISKELGPERLSALSAARALVLDRYNTFDVMLRACLSLPPAASRELVLRPQRAFRPSRLSRLVRRAARKLPSRLRGR